MAWPGVIAAYRPLLNVAHIEPITMLEGNTPLIPLPRLARELMIFNADLRAKFEGLNPTGSFKDRGMTAAMTQAVADGARSVICASTGNTAASAAAYAARAGRLPCRQLSSAYPLASATGAYTAMLETCSARVTPAAPAARSTDSVAATFTRS